MNSADSLIKLQQHLEQLQRVAIAFSGGVDSTLLLRVARDTLGTEQVLALTAATQLVPQREQQEARELAAMLGVRHEILHEDVLRFPEVAGNPHERCYHCKQHIFGRFRQRCDELGIEHLIDGTNLDDLGEDRPGLKALAELRVRSPLAACSIDKQTVRSLSGEFGLPTAERPSFACLATRIPFGTALTAENLTRVEQCEDYLHSNGFNNFRVRYHDSVARIELEEKDLPRMLDADLRQQLVMKFQGFGFTYITLDLQGFRSGSMSEVDS